MMYEYDVIVIGSGFGGAITAYELADKGYRVCILERGPQWTGEYFPGSTERGSMENLKDILCAARLNLYGVPISIRKILENIDLFNVMEKWKKPALWEYRVLGRMDVLTASGVGGGSLVYANVLHRARRDTFA
ncbi:MAG: FAD-dependent oxidoreductase, partial [Candidatus Brocadiales bacterium]